MIDLHCHILPQVDDGAKNMEEAIAMAVQAYEDGIRTIACTPHFYDGKTFVTGEALKTRLSLLEEHLAQACIDIRLVLGNEGFLTPDLLQCIKQDKVFTINQSRYLLVELPMNNYPIYVNDLCYELMLMGITPILAHPERYVKIMETPNTVFELVESGVLIQVNAGSLTGRLGKRVQEISQLLLSHDLVHFIASDAHSPRTRRPNISRAIHMASDLIGRDKAFQLVEANPLAILRNQEIEIVEPREIAEKNSFYFFHRKDFR